ncbi:MAG: hypothetical protein AAGD05_07460 [Bacteroidota bacterium]
MEITHLACNNCGADLEIPKKIKFFTCSYCGSSLTIKKSGHAVYTEILSDINANTKRIINHSTLLLIEKKIARLDREWSMKKKHFKKGERERPGSILLGLLVQIIALVGFSFVFIKSFNFRGSQEFFPLAFLGVTILIVFTVFQTLSRYSSASKFQKAQKKYMIQRAHLLQSLNSSPNKKT